MITTFSKFQLVSVFKNTYGFLTELINLNIALGRSGPYSGSQGMRPGRRSGGGEHLL